MSMHPPPPPPAVVEVTIHFDPFGVRHYEARPADRAASERTNGGKNNDEQATVAADGTIDLTRISTPVTLYFKVDPAEHHPFDRVAPLFTSNSPFEHTRRWRPDEQFRRIQLLDHGFTLRVDYHNIRIRHGRPMPANGYDLAFRGVERRDADPAIKNGSVNP
jgi:hypothetical protein